MPTSKASASVPTFLSRISSPPTPNMSQVLPCGKLESWVLLRRVWRRCLGRWIFRCQRDTFGMIITITSGENEIGLLHLNSIPPVEDFGKAPHWGSKIFKWNSIFNNSGMYVLLLLQEFLLSWSPNSCTFIYFQSILEAFSPDSHHFLAFQVGWHPWQLHESHTPFVQHLG